MVAPHPGSTKLSVVSRWRQFGGWWTRYSHLSQACSCDMTFSVYLPEAAKGPVPALKYLSGLTCTDENFVQKAGAARRAAERGIALIAPDTSPRGLEIPGEDDSYDFGSAAGFYIDATRDPWTKGYNMETYIVQELREVLKEIPEIDISNLGITGHSMGGHGALTLAMKHPDVYTTVSAFSPICNPTAVPWGKKAFEGYLGGNESDWSLHDATELVVKQNQLRDDILIDQGADDNFLVGDVNQLQPEAFKAACASVQQPLTLRYQDGYDHSYFFISSFIDDHIDFAADRLLASSSSS